VAEVGIGSKLRDQPTDLAIPMDPRSIPMSIPIPIPAPSISGNPGRECAWL